ncbi:MAG: BsuBI/PstI family type II restriction endonuclease [Bryobacteraceae bacterium]|jgi:hypothetical protein
MKAPLPPLLPVAEIQKRLLEIFPEGTANRGYCIREIAARTVFVMLYAGAIENGGVYIRPNQVTRMTDRQARKSSEEARLVWLQSSLAKEAGAIPGRWYAVDTREPIRDETLKDGLVPAGAVLVKANVPTTSSIPRYTLAASFAALFDPQLSGDALLQAVGNWQNRNLSASALARVQFVRRGVVATTEGVLVTFPSLETRKRAAGPSSVITKAVVEEFAVRFLANPGVIFLSESGNKVVERDDQLANAIGLTIPADRYLPDILLVDLGPADPLLVFVEVVATDGPITAGRRRAFLDITRAAGFKDHNIAFVTAFLDRATPAFRKTVPELAWNSFAWFAAEPDHIIAFREGYSAKPLRLSDLL